MVVHTYQKDERGYIIPNSDSSLGDIKIIRMINELNTDLKNAAIKAELQQKRRDAFYKNEAPVIVSRCKEILASDASDVCKNHAQMTIYRINGFPCD